MDDQEGISNGFLQISADLGSNDPPLKKKRNLPDPEAEVIALSPKTLMATNRFPCEICGKGFQRDQNLQLHRRGHNLPWKLKQRTSKEPRKRVYVCPEKACVHNHPSRALGDLTGIKKHFCRKHGEKKWKCVKCNKKYAVQSDWKAHSKTCGTREYKCDCGTIFSRRDSFITHRAFCEALAEETARMNATNTPFALNATAIATDNLNYHFMSPNIPPALAMAQHFSSIFKPLSSTTTTKVLESQTLDLQNQRVVLPFWSMSNSVSPGDAISFSNFETFQGSTTNNNTQHQFNSTFNPQNTLISVPGLNPPPESNNYSNLSRVFGSNTNTSSIPALYSTQHPQISSNNSSHFMSATALLQKAAQFGVTSTTTTTNDDLFLKNFGLMKENNNINDKNDKNLDNDGGSLYGTSNSATMNLGSDIEGSSVDDLSTVTTMYNNGNHAKRRKLYDDQQDNCMGGAGAGGGGQTRDFLGVSSQLVEYELTDGWKVGC
ncbi:zinc finger protein MAGPIE-like isoform X2 [Silene latifolia]|uniref:zinc finger protein MAGPIE-like isoform X2 n=1 Tax=Silene latifolia TaxID=37657 RepID=UPI003D77E37C